MVFIGLIVLMELCILVCVGRTVNVVDAFKTNLVLFYHFLSTHGWCMIAALAFLPTFGIPISPLWILAGVFWGIKLSLIIVALCLVFNLIFSYFFYQKCFNQILYKWILKKKDLTQLLHTDRLNSIKWCLLIQLIPQVPYMGQVYVLSSLKEVNFWHYLSISWLFQFLWAVGFILGGNALKYGQWGLMAFGLILLIIYLMHKGFARYRKL
jgi:SNARE associated Golgi protein.